MNEITKYIILFLLLVGFTFICIGIFYLLVNLFNQFIFGYGIPFIPSTDYKIEKLLEVIRIKKGQNFLDLGCGDGKILEAIKKKFGESNVFGIENSPKPYNLALKRKEKNNLDYMIIGKDFFKEDFSKYDVIYSYLMTYLMKKIWVKVKAECKPGTLFYASEFEIEGEKYIDKVIIEKKNYKGKIFVYEV